jgi:TRAP-type C4-dicarboxylate transport system substrate-binding protein
MKFHRLMALTLSVACALELPFVSIARADDVVRLKMAHQWPDDPNDYVVATGKKFATEVEKRSAGKIHIDIFPTESLVRALSMHSALRSGTVDLPSTPTSTPPVPFRR